MSQDHSSVLTDCLKHLPRGAALTEAQLVKLTGRRGADVIAALREAWWQVRQVASETPGGGWTYTLRSSQPRSLATQQGEGRRYEQHPSETGLTKPDAGDFSLQSVWSRGAAGSIERFLASKLGKVMLLAPGPMLVRDLVTATGDPQSSTCAMLRRRILEGVVRSDRMMDGRTRRWVHLYSLVRK